MHTAAQDWVRKQMAAVDAASSNARQQQSSAAAKLAAHPRLLRVVSDSTGMTCRHLKLPALASTPIPCLSPQLGCLQSKRGTEAPGARPSLSSCCAASG